MKTMYIVEVKPEWPGRAFPIDMLRYDHCFPDSQTDATTISSSLNNRSTNKRHVRVVMEREPTRARWESFGWTVVNCDIRHA